MTKLNNCTDAFKILELAKDKFESP